MNDEFRKCLFDKFKMITLDKELLLEAGSKWCYYKRVRAQRKGKAEETDNLIHFPWKKEAIELFHDYDSFRYEVFQYAVNEIKRFFYDTGGTPQLRYQEKTFTAVVSHFESYGAADLISVNNILFTENQDSILNARDQFLKDIMDEIDNQETAFSDTVKDLMSVIVKLQSNNHFLPDALLNKKIEEYKSSAFSDTIYMKNRKKGEEKGFIRIEKKLLEYEITCDKEGQLIGMIRTKSKIME